MKKYIIKNAKGAMRTFKPIFRKELHSFSKEMALTARRHLRKRAKPILKQLGLEITGGIAGSAIVAGASKRKDKRK